MHRFYSQRKLIAWMLAASLWCILPLHAQNERKQTSAAEGERIFALSVKPILDEKCLACHGSEPDDLQGGLDLRSLDSLRRGGDEFGAEILIDGDAEHSMLYVTTTRSEPGYEMPPKEADQLSEEQQWAIRDWIAAGAPWPSDARIAELQAEYSEGVTVDVSEALSPQWQNRRYAPEKLWAYRPLSAPDVPDGVHPVDWFIDRKLSSAGVEAAPRATPAALLRRLSFGLTGLPPTPKVAEEFQSKFTTNASAAVSSYADELMSSPHYGEHFGWRWLDVARYADTAGFANDYSRPNAWRYRDYVVRSFNEDRPYNEFVLQQVAGDEADPNNPENLIATGFLRMGPWEQTAMSVFKETRGQWLDDVTDTVGQAFLAHSMLCCKCHDHKFDPVPTRDYYSMMAVFSTTQFVERDVDFLAGENLDGFRESDRWVEAKIAAYASQEKELNAMMQARRKKELGDAKTGDNGLDPGDEASLARMRKNKTRHGIERDRTKPLALSVYTGKTIVKKNFVGRITMPQAPWSKGEFDEDAIRNGGNVHAIGVPVTPGALSAAQSLGNMPDYQFPAGKGKRRLALAKWITDSRNPLTARVIVNRVWSWHFGQGIAANPNNFGATGGLPTHPELLDYLAQWFMDNDWSIKRLNKLIISSQAYQRSTFHPAPQKLADADPLGQLYATFKPRRLTAEELRDAMLAVSGELNPTLGGIPCRPDLNPEVAFQPRQIMGGAASVYEPDPLPSQRNRRTLYAERIRGLRDPFLETFNQPGPDKSCELRETSIVAPQALTLLNSQEVFDRSIAFANRILKEQHRSDEEILKRAFRLALARTPTETELQACLQHWNRSTKIESEKDYEPPKFEAQIERTVMAEKTGKPYSFVEVMPAYHDYQPDLSPAEVDAKTRGLAAICRILLNTNEFAYVD